MSDTRPVVGKGKRGDLPGVRSVGYFHRFGMIFAGLTIASSLLGIDAGFQIMHARFGWAVAAAYLVSAAVVPTTVIVLRARKRRARLKRDQALARLYARGLADFAALLAGRKRPGLRDEWWAHLAGESGHDPVTWRQVKEASGFVTSAVRYRLTDAADAAWTPVDAVLKSRALSNLFALMPTGLAALILFRHGGTIGLLGSAESVSAICLTLRALVLAGRKYRNVKPPEPKPRRARELLPRACALVGSILTLVTRKDLMRDTDLPPGVGD